MVKRKGTRRGFAGDDVTHTEQFVEDVVAADRDESYVVEDTDSPHEIEQESTVITDDHNVVVTTETGTEEDFVAESDGGDAETIDEEGRAGSRRKGSRKGESDEDEELEEVEEELEDVEDEIEELDEEREGSRRKGVRRRGSRRGESVVLDEEGNTEEVELPEPDEREGSRRGAYGGKSPEHQASIQAAVRVAMTDRRL